MNLGWMTEPRKDIGVPCCHQDSNLPPPLHHFHSVPPLPTSLLPPALTYQHRWGFAAMWSWLLDAHGGGQALHTDVFSDT